MDEAAADFSQLSESDLQALRLAAQVMGHRAQLEERPAVAGYFSRLAELAGRRLDGSPAAAAHAASPPVPLQWLDRLLLSECLGLLADNERLSPAVRDTCRRLREQEAA